MTEDESDGQIAPFADDESAIDVFGEELWTEAKDVCSQARRLLGDGVPVGYGHTETTRVCFEFEKGLLLIAQYLVAHEQFNGDWPHLQAVLESKGKDGRAARTAVHEKVAGYFRNGLRKELDALTRGHHPILRAAAEKRGWRREKPPAGS